MKNVVFGLWIVLGLTAATGCGEKVDIVFDIQLAEPLEDGRPVISVKSNGKAMPKGTGPFGTYVLLLRKNGKDYYVRTFSDKEAVKGVKLDLAIGGMASDKDKLTVAVENVIPGTDKKTIRLSNSLVVTAPPPTVGNFAVPIPGREEK